MEVDISSRLVGKRGLCIQRYAKFIKPGLTLRAVVTEAKGVDVF